MPSGGEGPAKHVSGKTDLRRGNSAPGILPRGHFVLVIFLIFCAGFVWMKYRDKILEFIQPKKTAPAVYEKPRVKKITCYIGGQVARAGVYHLDEGSSISDLIAAAGGLTDKADLRSVSAATALKDRESVNIPKKSFFKRLGVGRAPSKTYFIPPIKVKEEK